MCAVMAHTQKQAIVVEQQQSALAFPEQFHAHRYLICGIADHLGQRRAVCRAGAFARQHEALGTKFGPMRLGRVRCIKRPAFTQRVAHKAVRSRNAVGSTRPPGGHWQGPRQIATERHGPAIGAPGHRLEQGLAAKRAQAVLVTVIDQVPMAARSFDRGRMSARPPWLGGTGGMDDRIVRGIFPRSGDAARSRGNDHVAGGRPRGAPHRADQVKPAVAAQQLGPFQRIGLGHPGIGVMPAVVGVLDRAVCGQSVIAQPYPADPRQKQVTMPVLTHNVTGIDISGNAKVDRIAPRTGDARRMDDMDVCPAFEPARPRRAHERDIDVIPTVMFGQVAGEHGAERRVERGTDRRPVDQVDRLPDHQARRRIERGMGHIPAIAIAQDGWIGMVAGHDRIAIETGAQVRLALALDSHTPARSRQRRTASRALRLRRRPAQQRPRRSGQGTLQCVSARGHHGLRFSPAWRCKSLSGSPRQPARVMVQKQIVFSSLLNDGNGMYEMRSRCCSPRRWSPFGKPPGKLTITVAGVPNPQRRS